MEVVNTQVLIYDLSKPYLALVSYEMFVGAVNYLYSSKYSEFLVALHKERVNSLFVALCFAFSIYYLDGDKGHIVTQTSTTPTLSRDVSNGE